MKRILTLFFCLAALLALSVPAFAAEAEPDPEYPEYTENVLDAYQASEEGFRNQIVQFFGEYTPRTQTVTEYLSDGSSVTYQEIVPGVAGMDWTWLVSVGIFALALYCIFRMIGGLFKCL